MPHPLTAGKPGQKWYMSSLKRHPKLGEKIKNINAKVQK